VAERFARIRDTLNERARRLFVGVKPWLWGTVASRWCRVQLGMRVERSVSVSIGIHELRELFLSTEIDLLGSAADPTG